MKVFFAGGGTGGHLYPGLAIARALKKLDPSVEPFFIGARRGIERDVLPESEFPFELLDLHPLYRARVWENWRTGRGALSAWKRIGQLVREHDPACVVGTGGYAAGLALAYAAAHRIPSVLQEQNTFPGLTMRFFSRFARQIHLGFPEAAALLKPGSTTRIFDSGNPIEPLPVDAGDRRHGRATWGFPDDDGKVLLVYGGSQGSVAINEATAGWLHRGIAEGLYVIWATGRGSFDRYSHFESERVKVRPYIAPMTDAYRTADMSVSRAGAMATAELLSWGIPMLLVPLPTAAADHQSANARALSAAGAAVLLPQSALSSESLAGAVNDSLSDPAKLESMRAKGLSRARPIAAQEIARHIYELLQLK